MTNGLGAAGSGSRIASITLAALAILYGCENRIVTSVEVEAVDVLPTEGELFPGDSLPLTAVTRDRDGIALPDREISWSSDDRGVASVSPDGVVKAHAPGSTLIHASSGQEQGTATVVVETAPFDVSASELRADPDVVTADGISTSTITVVLHDDVGAPVESGGHDVALASTGKATLGAVTDHENGTYTAVLTAPTVTGISVVSARVNGQDLEDQAVVVFAPGSPSPATSTVTADPVSIPAGSLYTSTITVRLRDARGNPLDRGGDRVTLRLSGPGTLSGVTDRGDGTYTARLFPPSSAGSATITGRVNREVIDDSATVWFSPFWIAAAGNETPVVREFEGGRLTD